MAGAGGEVSPPAALGRVGATLEADLRSPATARLLVRQACENWSLIELADIAMLLTSEVVTNAVQHAATSAHMTVTRRPDGLRVEVCDGRPEARLLQTSAGPEDPSGRGLMLVDALSSRWSVTANGAIKCVWFEVDFPAG